MVTKKDVLEKIKILVTQSFESPEEAFNFFDENNDACLGKKELRALVEKAGISRFVSRLVTSKLIEGLDLNGDGQIDWQEFTIAVDRLIDDETDLS